MYKRKKLFNGGVLASTLTGASTGTQIGTTFGVPQAGFAVGAAGGLLAGIINKNKLDEANLKQKQDLQNQANSVFKDTTKNILENFPTYGVKGQGLYLALGGQMKGGKLLPLSSKAMLVVGDTHNEDTNGDGETGVIIGDNEVEDGEVIFYDNKDKSHKVLSKRLGYADKAIKTNNIKDLKNLYNEQEKMKINSKFKKASKVLALGGILEEENKPTINITGRDDRDYFFNKPKATTISMQSKSPNLYTPNEISLNTIDESKATLPIGSTDRDKFGFKPSQIIQASRFLDNIVNNQLIKNTPQVPNPVLNPVRSLKTNFNISSSIEENNTDFMAFSKDLDRTVGGGTGLANRQAAFSKLLKEKNRLFNLKENTENEMINKDIAFNQAQTSNNNALINATKMANYQRDMGIQGRVSQNAANIQQDLAAIYKDKSLSAQQATAIDLIITAFNREGVMTRNMYDSIVRAFDGDESHPIVQKLKAQITE